MFTDFRLRGARFAMRGAVARAALSAALLAALSVNASALWSAYKHGRVNAE